MRENLFEHIPTKETQIAPAAGGGAIFTVIHSANKMKVARLVAATTQL